MQVVAVVSRDGLVLDQGLADLLEVPIPVLQAVDAFQARVVSFTQVDVEIKVLRYFCVHLAVSLDEPRVAKSQPVLRGLS